MYVCMYLEHITGELPDTKVSTNIVLKHIHNTFFKKPFLHLGFTLGLNQQIQRLWAFDTLALYHGKGTLVRSSIPGFGPTISLSMKPTVAK